VTEAEIRASFNAGWRIDSIVPATMDVTIDPRGVQAWFCTFTRV
jgi:hypothetical protein